MIDEVFVASTPKEAYELALKKYGKNIKVNSAKQIKDSSGKLRSEITIGIDEETYMKYSIGNKDLTTDHKVTSLFTNKGISQKWIESVLETIEERTILEHDELLVSYILEEMDESLSVKEESFNGQKIVMLVGPTGVGKTTTVAKLAARYAYLMDEHKKVALINLDNYKVGASDQVNYYSDIMKIAHKNVHSIDAFKDAIEEFSSYDIVLVDTAGMSPYDTQKFIKTTEFITSGVDIAIEVNLVLSATVKYEDMNDIYKNFSFLNLNSLIITKFDETKHFGSLLNFMLIYGLPMSYFSVGQEVPDDLRVASNEFLLEQFIGDLSEGK